MEYISILPTIVIIIVLMAISPSNDNPKEHRG